MCTYLQYHLKIHNFYVYFLAINFESCVDNEICNHSMYTLNRKKINAPHKLDDLSYVFIFTDPCAVDNGGCDQVCAPGGNCLCTDGYTLDSDGKRCNGLFTV